MAKITWDDVGKRFYETGVDHTVLYPMGASSTYGTGVPWNGIVNITESPSGAESNPQYADNIKYLDLTSAEEFGGTIEAFTYPDEFAECDGSVEPQPGVIIGQQERKMFALSYRTKIGNDTEGESHAYKLHLVYGIKASPSEKAYSTINDSPEAATLSWEFTTTPVPVTGYKPTSCIIIDSRRAPAEKLTELEKKLYGDANSGEPTIPMPDEVITILTGE